MAANVFVSFLLICAAVEAGKEECFLQIERLRSQKTKIQTGSLMKMSSISLGKVINGSCALFPFSNLRLSFLLSSIWLICLER